MLPPGLSTRQEAAVSGREQAKIDLHRHFGIETKFENIGSLLDPGFIENNWFC